MVRLKAVFTVLHEYEQKVGTNPHIDVTDEVNRRLNQWRTFFTGAHNEGTVRVWVRRYLLEEWLGEYLIRGVIKVEPQTGLTISQVQQILDWPWPYVPVCGLSPSEQAVDTAFPIVVNRDSFALELAREWVARELPRNPVR